MSQPDDPTKLGPYLQPKAVSPFAREVEIRARLAPLDDADRLRILVRPPHQDWWYGGSYRPPTKILQVAQEALYAYRLKQWPEPGEEKTSRWSFRCRKSAATGLPLYLRARVPAPPQDAEGAADLATPWLHDSPNLTMALFGHPDWPEFFGGPQVAVTRIPYRGGDSVSWDVQYYVRYLQHHREWPVLGGQFTVHLGQGDQRASIASSYLPISGALQFKPQIPQERAIYHALLALEHYAYPATSELPPPSTSVTLFADWRPVDDEHGLHSRAVVLPFGGTYHLAYEVHLTAPDRSTTWSVFVDAQSGDVLGRPYNLALHAFAYKDSREALNPPQAPARPSIEQDLAANPCQPFMDIKFYDPAISAARELARPCTEQSGPQFEATNIAIHASRLYEHFRHLTVDDCRLTPPTERRLTAVAGNSSPQGQLDVHFAVACREISFPRQEGDNGLKDAETGIPVYHPAHDPDLVYHEVAHALMWLLNPSTFQNWPETPPFARSQLEGYATYFAHSLAAIQHNPPEHWAPAAYRVDDWHEEWALDRELAEPGQDLLALHLLYPQAILDGLTLYDVGMIWARALWDLRELVGPPLGDTLALNASRCVSGWWPSFEIIAEELIEAGTRSRSAYLDDALPPLLAARRLCAESSIRGLALLDHGNPDHQEILVGTGVGLMRFRDGLWEGPSSERILGTSSSIPLSDVVALVGDADTAYAATDTDVYRRGPTDAIWSPVAAWPANLSPTRPLSLALPPGGQLQVGTGEGVWAADPASGSWVSANPDPAQENYTGLALDIAPGSPGLFVAGYTRLPIWSGAKDKSWKVITLQSARKDLVLCVASLGDVVFAGTGNAGIWRGQVVDGEWVLEQIGAPAKLGGAAVLSLAVPDPATPTLYAGTSDGLYKGQPFAHDWSWTKLGSGLPEGAAVTALLWTARDFFVGTSQHGLWHGAENNLQPVAGVDEIAGPRVPRLDHKNLSATIPAPGDVDAAALRIHPFFVAEAAFILVSATTPPVQPLQLWWVGLNARFVQSAEPDHPELLAKFLQPGFYAVRVRGDASYPLTIEAHP